MEGQAKREDRIEFRVSPEEKEMFRQAQMLSGDKSFSQFITRILREMSAKIIHEHERILASEKDRKVFYQAIFADIEPNDALMAAALKYQKSQE